MLFAEFSRPGDFRQFSAGHPTIFSDMAWDGRCISVYGFFFLSAFFQRAIAQEPHPIEQVQAIISGLHSPQEAFLVDKHIGHIPGVLLSRTDFHTNDLYLLVRADSPDQQDAVRGVLDRMGLHMGCWTRRPRNGEPFTHPDPARCDELPQLK